MGGMNETGLSCSTMLLDGIKFPVPDSRLPASIGKWLQYHLGNNESIADVLASEKQLRIRETKSDLRAHFFSVTARVIVRLVFSVFICAVPGKAESAELIGSATLESRLFPDSPAYTGQKHNDFSIALNAELHHRFPSGSSITITPFARIDSTDPERTHLDLRELNYFYLTGNWEITSGISRVFWGATEFVHLVDIINQTDLVEGLDGEEKLGQPMIHLSMINDWGVLEGFLLPYFRERTFPGKHGRLRRPAVINSSQALYESGAGQHHLDIAVRYSHTLGKCDFGISQFIGTGREPTFISQTSRPGDTVLIPYYQQISQTSVDIQMVYGEWLFKGEAFYRTGQGKNFKATTFGIEYTMYGLLESEMDLGFIGEYVFDDRDESMPTPYNNDLMIGCRWSFGDMEGTELLAGIVKDMEHSSVFFTVEGSRRIGETFKIEVTGSYFGALNDNDPLSILKEDSFINIDLIYYF